MFYAILLPFWWIFTIPGRCQLWINYMFPSDAAQAFASDRQRSSTPIMLWYSIKFWVFWGTASFFMSGLALLALQHMYQVAGQDGYMTPFWLNIYWSLDSNWFAQQSLHMILRLVKWMIKVKNTGQFSI